MMAIYFLLAIIIGFIVFIVSFYRYLMQEYEYEKTNNIEKKKYPDYIVDEVRSTGAITIYSSDWLINSWMANKYLNNHWDQPSSIDDEIKDRFRLKP